MRKTYTCCCNKKVKAVDPYNKNLIGIRECSNYCGRLVCKSCREWNERSCGEGLCGECYERKYMDWGDDDGFRCEGDSYIVDYTYQRKNIND